MNKSYVIVPGLLLAVFLGVERDFQRKRAEEESVRQTLADAARIEEERVRTLKQQTAAEELRKRAAEREQQERARAEKKRRDYEAAVAALERQADTASTEAERLFAEAAALRNELANTRKKLAASERELFDLARDVALQRVDRRSAEIEIQRTTAMVAARLTESPWAQPAPTKSP